MCNSVKFILRIIGLAISCMLFVVLIQIIVAICFFSVAQSLLGQPDQALAQGSQRNLVVPLFQAELSRFMNSLIY